MRTISRYRVSLVESLIDNSSVVIVAVCAVLALTGAFFGIIKAVHASHRSGERYSRQIAPLLAKVVERSTETVQQTGAVVSISEIADPSVIAEGGHFEQLALSGHAEDIADRLAQRYHIETGNLSDGEQVCADVASGVRGCYKRAGYDGYVHLFTFETVR